MRQLEVSIKGEYIKLNQLLKLAGLCDSGGAGKALVGNGSVRVDGDVELRKACKIRAGQVVCTGDAQVTVLAEGIKDGMKAEMR